jgi:hypothetical protein
MIPANVWQRTLPGDVEALVSCVVSPGFDFADFLPQTVRLASGQSRVFPNHVVAFGLLLYGSIATNPLER